MMLFMGQMLPFTRAGGRVSASYTFGQELLVALQQGVLIYIITSSIRE